MTKTVILCGGLGTRMREETEFKPKPMVTIGNQPIIYHIMKFYSCFNFNEFILTLGYKGWHIKEYFLNYNYRSSSFSIDLGSNKTKSLDIAHNKSENWNISLIETGTSTSTGGRISLIKDNLMHDDYFLLTYGDGLSDVKISEVINSHKKSGKLATLVAIPHKSRFGVIKVDENDKCVSFNEKILDESSWINGGFFIFNKKSLDYLSENLNESLEEGMLTRLTKDGQLNVFKHFGFWQCMDTQREVELLNNIWNNGRAPWLL